MFLTHTPKLFLCTGGTGFLGLHLIPLLLASKAKVRVLSRSPPGDGEFIEGVEYVSGSISNFQDVNRACLGVDGIFHLAGLVVHTRREEEKKRMYDTNVTGTMNVLRAAHTQKIKRVVYASSSGVIACSQYYKEHLDDMAYCLDVVQNWPYYASKIEAEIQGKEYAAAHGIDFIMMRPSVMLGPGDVRFRSTHIILQYMDGKVPITPTGGYSFVDVRDAAMAFKVAMEKGEGGEGYFLTAINPTTSEFFDSLTLLSKSPKPKLSVPPTLLIAAVKIVDAFNQRVRGQWNSSMDPVRVEMSTHFWSASSSKAKKQLNFTPRDPKKTLTDTIRWIELNRERFGHAKGHNNNSSATSQTTSKSPARAKL